MILSNQQYCFLVCLLLMQMAAVRAQETAQDSVVPDSGRQTRLHVLIDEGYIEQRPGEVDRSASSAAYTVIEAARFRDTFVSLDEVLEQEVGVQTRSTGGEGSLSTVVLRGAAAEQVIIYLDGVPLNDASGGAVDLSLIPLDNIERIDIYRGSTPLELGSPSIGGAVNIITRRTADDSPAASATRSSHRLSASLASFQTYRLNASSQLSSAKDDVLLTGGYLQSENNFSYLNDNGTGLNPADDRVETRNNDAVRHLTALGNWKHRFNRRYSSELRLDLSDRYKEIPAVSNSPDVQTRLDTRIYNLLAQLNALQFGRKDVNGNIKLFATSKKEVFDDSLAQIGFINQHSTALTRKAGGQLYAEIVRPQTHWKLLSGYSRESYDIDNSLSLVQSDTNRRSQGEVSVENVSYFDEQRFITSLALRYQQIDDTVATKTDEFGNIVPGFNKNYRLLSPQLGLKYRLDRRTYASANIGQYHRAPSFLELFGGSGLLLGNADLLQETSINSDMGLTYGWFKPYHWLHNAEAYAGVFYNRVKDLIVYIYNGQGVGVPENISNAVIRGLEFTLKLLPSKRHTISANASLTDSLNESDIGSFNGKRLPGYYRQSLSLRYAYSLQRWVFSMEADIKRDMFYDRSNLLPGDDVNLLNLGLRYLHQRSTVDFRVNNLLDENIRYFRNRPTPGRNLSLTYSYLF